MLKPKKFIDIVKNLTIYFDKKNNIGELENIFLRSNTNANNYKIIFAKKGRFEFRGDRKILVLYNGKTINNNNGKVSEFQFSKSDFNLTKFDTKSTLHQKTQENSTSELLICLSYLKDYKEIKRSKNIYNINNCKIENTKNIYKELYIRLIKPLYATFLISISLLLILKSKDEPLFKFYKIKIYLFGFFSIIFLEASSSFIKTNILQNLFVSILPLLLFLLIYYYFLSKLKFIKK